jgi:hypothetical protein
MTTAFTATSLYRHDHHQVNGIAGSALSGGDLVVLADGRLGQVAGLETIASGDPVAYNVVGQIDIASASGTTFAVGDSVYFNTSTLLAVTAPGANVVYAGRCTKAKVSGDLSVLTDLNVGGPVNAISAIIASRPAAGYKIAAGVHTQVAASDTVATGLTTVLAVIATLQSDPADACSWVSADIGDQAGAPAAGSFLLKTWKNTSGTDPTPLAATSFGQAVNWIAIGT